MNHLFVLGAVGTTSPLTCLLLALSRVAAVAYVKSGAVATTIRAGNVPTRSNMCAGDWGGPLIKWSPASQTVVSNGRNWGRPLWWALNHTSAYLAGCQSSSMLTWHFPFPRPQVGLYVSGPPCDLAGTDTPISYYTDVSNKNVRDFINGILAINGQPAV